MTRLSSFCKVRDIDAQLAILKSLAKDLLDKMPYTKSVTHVGTTAEQAFAMAAGVCQDHTHVFLALLRDKGIAARYVSGYIYGSDQAHMASHAWAEVWLAGNWYTFDISNQHFTPIAHVYIAFGRDYADAAPVRGVRTGAVTSDCIVKSWYLQAPSTYRSLTRSLQRSSNLPLLIHYYLLNQYLLKRNNHDLLCGYPTQRRDDFRQ